MLNVDPSPEASPRYRRLARLPRAELEALLRRGKGPAPSELAGWEFRGFNTPPFTALLGIRKFIKGFFDAGRGLEGFNIPARQNGLGEPWTQKPSPRSPKRFGFYRVVEGDARYPGSLLLDYGSSARNFALRPERALRDYLVADPEGSGVLIGKAYLALGAWLPTSYFLIERLRPSSWRPAAALAAALLLAAPAAAKPAARPFHALSFNAAALPVVHGKLGARLRALGRTLPGSGFDVVALQELWLDRDAAALVELARYPEAARPGRRCGLLTLSRHPILESADLEFALRPSWLRLAQGEPLARKGALLTRLKTPRGELDVYNAHLIAAYPGAANRAIRLAQVYQLAAFILERSRGRRVLLLADLNSGPGQREYELLRELLGLADPCWDSRELCGRSGAASDPARVDHALMPAGGERGALAGLVLGEPLKVEGVPLSDHRGLAVRLTDAFWASTLAPRPAARAAALRSLERELGAAMSRMWERKNRLAWIPLYGFALNWQIDRQLGRLWSLRWRAETDRIRELARARP